MPATLRSPQHASCFPPYLPAVHREGRSTRARPQARVQHCRSGRPRGRRRGRDQPWPARDQRWQNPSRGPCGAAGAHGPDLRRRCRSKPAINVDCGHAGPHAPPHLERRLGGHFQSHLREDGQQHEAAGGVAGGLRSSSFERLRTVAAPPRCPAKPTCKPTLANRPLSHTAGVDEADFGRGVDWRATRF